jgi:hypothetical protein
VGRRKKAKQPGRRGSIKFCSNARFVGEKGKGEGDHAASTERRAAPACLTGRRGGHSGHLLDVEERGAASAGNAGGGRRDRATRGARSEGRRAAGRRSGPGRGSGVQQRRKQREDRDWGRRRGPGCKKAENTGTSLYCIGNFPNSAQMEMGPKAKVCSFSKCTTLL